MLCIKSCVKLTDNVNCSDEAVRGNARMSNCSFPLCLSGISMEALCSTTAMLEDHTVVQCLKALYTLLSSSWPRRQLGEDPVLCRELLNVMHRYRRLTGHISLCLTLSLSDFRLWLSLPVCPC